MACTPAPPRKVNNAHSERIWETRIDVPKFKVEQLAEGVLPEPTWTWKDYFLNPHVYPASTRDASDLETNSRPLSAPTPIGYTSKLWISCRGKNFKKRYEAGRYSDITIMSLMRLGPTSLVARR